MNRPQKGGAAPRIGSGILSGMVLAVPPGSQTRPTASKVRAAITNMLQGRLPGAAILDLFAGSGAVGLESVSRGASHCCFVEADRGAFVTLKANCAEAQRRFMAQGVQGLGTLPKVVLDPVLSDVMGFLQKALGKPADFDLIWADPPYDLVPKIAEELLTLSMRRLRPEGTLLLESRFDWSPKEVGQGWRLVKNRIYGDTRISLFETHL